MNNTKSSGQESIISASAHTPSEQGATVRPTLDHLVELTCKAIVRCARKGLLPIAGGR